MKRALVIIAALAAVLAIAGGFAFAFGTPQAPDVAAPAASGAATSPVAPGGEPAAASAAQPDSTFGKSAGGGVSASGARVVPAPDPSVPLAIEIPGCVCHSDDPKIVKEHSDYRMNQCAGCHAGETPTGM